MQNGIDLVSLVSYFGRKLTSRKFALALAALVAVLLEDIPDEKRAIALGIISGIYAFSEALVDAFGNRTQQ
jgi:hypothetical protein